MNRPPRGFWQWDDVRFFLAVARASSLSGAARALGVGHVTVGRHITQLEKRLGVTLLNRTPDGFAMTAAGDAILRQCIAMENAALDLERVAAGRDALVTGLVRVTTTEALAHQIIAPTIAALRQTHRDLQIDLSVGVRSLDIARRRSRGQIRTTRRFRSHLPQTWRGRFLALCVATVLGEIGSAEARSGISRLRHHHFHGRASRDESILHGRIIGGRTRCAPLRQSAHPT